MFTKVKVLCANPPHRRLYTSIHKARRKYVSMSPRSYCHLPRSKRPWFGQHLSAQTRWSTSLSEQRKVHERWREKDEEKTRSAESVRTEMIQVLTYKMERMILHDSHGCLSLPLNPANAQSIAEERWTDFDAFTVIPISALQETSQFRTQEKESSKKVLNPADVSDWQKELRTFKSSLFKEKCNLRLVKLPPKKLPKNFILGKKLAEDASISNEANLKTEKINATSATELEKNSTKVDFLHDHQRLSSHEIQPKDIPNLNVQLNVFPDPGSGRNHIDIGSQDAAVQKGVDESPLDITVQKRAETSSQAAAVQKSVDNNSQYDALQKSFDNSSQYDTVLKRVDNELQDVTVQKHVDSSLQDVTVQKSVDSSSQDASIPQSVHIENVLLNNAEQLSRVKEEKSHSLKQIPEFKEAVHDAEAFSGTSAISSAVTNINPIDHPLFMPQTDVSTLGKEHNVGTAAADLKYTQSSNLSFNSMVEVQEEIKFHEELPLHLGETSHEGLSIHPDETSHKGLPIHPDETSHDVIDLEIRSNPAEDVSITDLETDAVSVKSAPPVFHSQAKKKKDAKQKSPQKGSARTTRKAPLSTQPVDVEKRIAMFNLDLLAYVEASVQAGMVSHAQATLNYYRYNGSQKSTKKVLEKDVDKSFLKIRDVRIYNLVMHAWAKQSKLEAVKQCFAAMKSDGIRPTLQSYAACLECIGRQDSNNLTVTRRVLADILKDGFDAKEIFSQCVFRKDEREWVYKAIKKAVPDYEPNSQGEKTQYDNILLKDLITETSEQTVQPNQYSGVVTIETLEERGDNQMQLEMGGDVKVRSVASRENPSEKCLKMREVLSSTEEEWRGMIRNGLQRRIRHLRRKDKGEQGMTLYPYLKLLKLDDYINQVMKEIHLLSTEAEMFSPGSSFLWRRLGLRLYQKAVIQQKVKSNITEKTLEIYKQYAGRYCDKDLMADNHRLCWQEICAQNADGPSLDQPDRMWPLHVVKGLGKLLYDIILYDVKFDGNVLKSTDERKIIPAFYTIYRNYGHTTKEEIKPHPTLVKVYVGAELDDLIFETRELPMLVPPLPWMSAQTGGYLLSTAPLVRLPDQAHGQRQILKNTPPQQLYPVLDSLNTLSACAWQINKPMLDLIISVFNNKGNKDLDIPPPVSEAKPIPRLTKSMTSAERSKAYSERLKVKQQRSEMYSLWCNELYKLSIANKFREETFWFPHNLDFRGRTYPCPPHFNHLGSDVTRSILYFAKGKMLGKKGLDWLKIHLINLTGFKKRAPNSERLSYADSLMEDILDSADNPLTGRKWWQTSDEPWQTLACCKEIALAVRSPDHTQFVSKFPVHQDGSCNGLQHYAALGRDQAGAESVNLYPFTEPKDVYSDVAVLVERERAKDAKEGSEVAVALGGFVRRKVIKQTVMTTVYGVTRYGAKYQILRQLKDIPEFPQQLAWPASMYLTEKTFLCLQEMFSATKEIQDWLTVSAHLISTVCGKPVDWVTPLGFPITQPYHKTTSSHRSGVGVTDSNSLFEKPNTRKQKNAFPPNFIHSLDSTHMMLTALHCLKAGITYVSVHDCFWTHPCDVEVMNKITREQFVALHGQPILQDLSEHLLARFGSHTEVNKHLSGWDAESHKFLDTVLSRVPKTGDFDLNNILKSTYFFS